LFIHLEDMKNHSEEFHPYLTEKSLQGIISGLSTASNLSYGTIDKLSVMSSAIKDALVIGNVEGLKAFLWEVENAVTELTKSNNTPL
jgi:hypothetical protein